MTGDFAIIAEGFTDQVVLKNVLSGWFSERSDLFVNFEQPLLDATSTSTLHQPGGWTLVVQYFEARKYLQALQTNRYLVVHIDTDIAADLGVPSTLKGRPPSADELLDAVVAKLRGLVDEETWTAHGSRFLFAIGFDSIECWFLPLVFDRSKKAKLKKTSGCLAALDHERKLHNEAPFSRAEGKQPDVYRRVSEAGFGERSDVERAATHNRGFARFTEQLKSISLDEE